ncbi:MAG: hypothetical protein SF069_06450 [Phycisphaerae bacterium]|nr:hypothetical protein [Phycisphaerae bacterium]
MSASIEYGVSTNSTAAATQMGSESAPPSPLNGFNPEHGRMFWAGIIGIASLALIAFGGQAAGLWSITTYARVRGQLVSAQEEYSRLSAQIAAMRADVSTIHAELSQSKEEASRLQQRVTEARRSEQLALEAATKAQEDFAKLTAGYQVISKERDVATQARDQARQDIEKLAANITSLRSDKQSLDAAVAALTQTRQNLDQTVTQLKRETASLTEVSGLVTNKRTEVRDLETRLQDLTAQVEATRARQQAASAASVDVRALEQKKKELADAIQSLDQQHAAGREKLAAVQAELELARGKLVAATARFDTLSKEEKRLKDENEVLRSGTAQAERTLRTTRAELETRQQDIRDLQRQIDEKRTELTAVIAKSTAESEALKHIEKQRMELTVASQDLNKTRDALLSAREELAALDRQSATRRTEIESATARLDALRADESRWFTRLRDVLDTLRVSTGSDRNLPFPESQPVSTSQISHD